MSKAHTAKAVKSAHALEEQIWCYEQRLGGLTERQIHALFPIRFERTVALSTIHRRLADERADRLVLKDEKREELVLQEADKLDRYLMSIHDLMMPTTTVEIEGREVEVPQKAEVRIAAYGRALEISRERRRLLGIDAPSQSEVTVTTIDPTDIELTKLVAEMEKADRKAAKKAKGKKSKKGKARL